jgi:hypothetical protein
MILCKKPELLCSHGARWWQRRSESDVGPQHAFMESFMHLGEGFGKEYYAPGEGEKFILPERDDNDARLRYSTEAF